MAQTAPTASKIRTAKVNAVGGMRKRCVKGKSCSATCIAGNEDCLVEMPESAGIATTRVRDFVIAGEYSKYIPPRLSGSQLVDRIQQLAKEGVPQEEILRRTGYENDPETFNKILSAGPEKKGDDLLFSAIDVISGNPSSITEEELARKAGYLTKDLRGDVERFRGPFRDAIYDGRNGLLQHIADKKGISGIVKTQAKDVLAARERGIPEDALTGLRLIEFIKNNPDMSKTELAKEAGFVNNFYGWQSPDLYNLHLALSDARSDMAEKWFKEEGGYAFRQKVGPVKPLDGEQDEKVSYLWKDHVPKLMGAGANFSNQNDGKPFINAVSNELMLVSKVGKNNVKLSVDNENIILWRVNNSISREENANLSPAEKRQIAVSARKDWDILLRSFDEGTILKTSAYDGDGGGESRVKAYKTMGFGDPEGGAGTDQFAKVTKYGLKPLKPYLGEQLYYKQNPQDDDYYDEEDGYYDEDGEWTTSYSEQPQEHFESLGNDPVVEALMTILF